MAKSAMPNTINATSQGMILDNKKTTPTRTKLNAMMKRNKERSMRKSLFWIWFMNLFKAESSKENRLSIFSLMNMEKTPLFPCFFVFSFFIGTLRETDYKSFMEGSDVENIIIVGEHHLLSGVPTIIILKEREIIHNSMLHARSSDFGVQFGVKGLVEIVGYHQEIRLSCFL